MDDGFTGMPPKRTRNERRHLGDLLAAFDARAPDRLQLVAERPRSGTLFGALEERGLADLDVALVLAGLAMRLQGEPGVTGGDPTWVEQGSYVATDMLIVDVAWVPGGTGVT